MYWVEELGKMQTEWVIGKTKLVFLNYPAFAAVGSMYLFFAKKKMKNKSTMSKTVQDLIFRYHENA